MSSTRQFIDGMMCIKYRLLLLTVGLLWWTSSICYAAVLFSDSFSETTVDTTLSVHTPDIGSSWTLLTAVGAATLQVDNASDFLEVGTGGNGDGALYTADLASAYPSANYKVSVTQTNGDTGDDMNILAARIQDANNMYAVRWNESSGQIYKNVAGTWSTLGAATAGVADGSTVPLRVVGNVIAFLDDGVTLQAVTDTSHTNPGKAGIGMGAVILTGDDLSTQQLDNFTVTTIHRLLSVV